MGVKGLERREWTLRGRCWVLGDDLVMDHDVMAFRFAIERITDPEVLVPHLFEEVMPDFASQTKPGDIVVAGRNFGKGHPHTQGFVAMKALGLGLITHSMPFNTFRAAISQGVLCLPECPTIKDHVLQGDELEVNFATGQVLNHTQGLQIQYSPIDPMLQDIVAAGGMKGFLRHQLAGRAKNGERS